MSIYNHTIRELHFEPTSNCNARCPLCPRTFYQSMNSHPLLDIEEWSDEEVERVLDDKIFDNLQSVLINGNFGDLMIHSNPASILQVFMDRDLQININTNGGAQSLEFWKWLGRYGQIKIKFGIDGLENTHHLYRRNTQFHKIIENAKTFINAGGNAVWMMTVFDHNTDEIEKCKILSKKLGFSDFKYRISNRHNGHLSVVDKKFNHSYYLVSGNSSDKFGIDKEQYIRGYDDYSTQFAPYEEIRQKDKTKIECYAKKESSIFLSFDKRMWPCCWTGHAFQQERMGNKIKDIYNIYDKEIKKDFYFNNVVVYTPSEVFKRLKGFRKFKKTWESSRPCITCQNTCGEKI